MQCHCCEQPMELARKVKLRPVQKIDGATVDLFTKQGGKSSLAYQSYKNNMTYRWAFICHACYRILDNKLGVAEIPGRGQFNLASLSRGDKAAIVNEAKYREFQRKEAEKMGLQE
jgi:hypothetical protein